jgi:hypothetical protein
MSRSRKIPQEPNRSSIYTFEWMLNEFSTNINEVPKENKENISLDRVNSLCAS